MITDGYACEPIWALDPEATAYDPTREQAFVHWVPYEEEDFFFLLHYSPSLGAAAYKIGTTHIDVFVFDLSGDEARLSFSKPYKGPAHVGELIGPRAIAAAANEAWRAIRESVFDHQTLWRFIENPAVKKLVEDTRARPHIIRRIPTGLEAFCGR